MRIDKTKFIVDGGALFVAALLAISIGALTPVYVLPPAALAAIGAAALYVARFLMQYIAGLPNGVGESDLQQLLGALAKTEQLAQVVNILSGSQKQQYDAVMAKLNSMVHPLILEPTVVTPPAQQAEASVAPETGPPATTGEAAVAAAA